MTTVADQYPPSSACSYNFNSKFRICSIQKFEKCPKFGLQTLVALQLQSVRAFILLNVNINFIFLKFETYQTLKIIKNERYYYYYKYQYCWFSSIELSIVLLGPNPPSMYPITGHLIRSIYLKPDWRNKKGILVEGQALCTQRSFTARGSLVTFLEKLRASVWWRGHVFDDLGCDRQMDVMK